MTLPPPLVRLPTLTPARVRLAVGGVLAVVVAVTAARYYAKAAKPSRLGDQTRTAFLRWRPQVLALDAGTDIYRAYQYPNPPVMAVVLSPLMRLPPLAGAMAWFALKTLMACFVVGWAFRILFDQTRRQGDKGTRRPSHPSSLSPCLLVSLSVAMVVALHPVFGDLSHGNVNLFVAFLTVGALELFRRRLDAAAGVAIALAIACKVTPALFLPYFAWKRAWRLLAGAAVGLALWLAVVPGAVLGWDYNQTLLASWFDVMVRPFVLDGKVTSEHPNQSVPGLAFRLLTAEPSFWEYDDEDGRPIAVDFHTLIDLGPANAKRVVLAAQLLFAAAVVWLCRWPTWKAGVPRAGPAFAAECGLVLLGMLLFSERTWKHHATAQVLPLAVLAWAAASPAVPRAARMWVGGTLGVVLGLTIGPSLAGERVQDLALVYGTYTAAFALEAVALGVVMWSVRPRRDRRPQPDPGLHPEGVGALSPGQGALRPAALGPGTNPPPA